MAVLSFLLLLTVMVNGKVNSLDGIVAMRRQRGQTGGGEEAKPADAPQEAAPPAAVNGLAARSRDHERRIQALETAIYRLAKEVFAIRQHVR
jgi:hypothetical protein